MRVRVIGRYGDEQIILDVSKEMLTLDAAYKWIDVVSEAGIIECKKFATKGLVILKDPIQSYIIGA